MFFLHVCCYPYLVPNGTIQKPLSILTINFLNKGQKFYDPWITLGADAPSEDFT